MPSSQNLPSRPLRRRGGAAVYIPAEVLDQILVRLPIKSLARCKCVCKPWRSLIHSPPFNDLFRQRRSRDYTDRLVFSPYTNIPSLHPPTPRINLSPLHLPPHMRRLRLPNRDSDWRRAAHALGPLSNGIYLFVASFHVLQSCRVSLPTSKIALCNPTTRDYKLAAPFPSDSIPLLSDIAEYPCRVHYGFGTTQLDHKVVVVISWGEQWTSFLSFVYSLRRGSWIKIVEYESSKRHYCKDWKAVSGLVRGEEVKYPEFTQDLEVCPQRLLEGCWHWMAYSYNYVYSVVSFDLADEAFKYIGAPTGYGPDSSMRCGGVLVLNDHLAAVYYPCPSNRVDVWMMMEYGVEESWTKIYAIAYPGPGFHGYFWRLLGISSQPLSDDNGGGGNGIQTMFFQDCGKRVIACDDFGYKDLGVFDISSAIWWNTLGISTYVESLQPL